MPELDRLKEQVAYLKLWQGMMVVADISLVGWLASAADGTRPVLVALAVITVALVTIGIVLVHRQRGLKLGSVKLGSENNFLDSRLTGP